MKYLDEYRDGRAAQRLATAIAQAASRPWTIMEVCGGQTHSIVKHGLDQLLPPGIELVHGPGCPVCVTPVATIDRSHAIAAREDVTFCSFGDMLRVPGSRGDLLQLKSRGRDVRVVYSPLDAVNYAAAHPERKVVFFAIGFETTAPANAMAAWLARRRGLTNFSLLVSQVLVPPAITAIVEAPTNRVQAFLGPGHVCTVTGFTDYEPIARGYHVPIVITGFEPVDLLIGVLAAVRQLEAGRAEVENPYARVVQRDGNDASRRLIDEVFEVCDRAWRGLGVIPRSGLALRDEYRDFDAEQLFGVDHIDVKESTVCISGQILQGLKKPCDCPAFGALCTPLTPLGATMVSAEGACAAYYAYRRQPQPTDVRGAAPRTLAPDADRLVAAASGHGERN